jgi:hypothetical protein
MTAAKTDPQPRRAFGRAFGVLLAVAACVPFNGCNLNPRPESTNADKGSDFPGLPGGSGGVTGSPAPGAGGAFSTGTGGAAAPSAFPQDGGSSDPTVEGGAETTDGSVVDGATGPDALDGPT